MQSQAVPSVEEIVATFRATDVEARKRLIGRCPPGRFTDMALTSAGFSTPGTNLISLQFLIDSYAENHQEFGAALGEACFRLACEACDGPGKNPSALVAAGNAAKGWLTSLSKVGRYAEARKHGIDALQWLTAKGDTTNVPGLRFHLFEAAFGLQDYDEAERILDSVDEASLPFELEIIYGSCRDRLDRAKGTGTKLRDEIDDDPRLRLRKILGIASTLFPGETGGAAAGEEYVKSLIPMSDEIMKALGGADSDNDIAVNHRIVQANQLFLDPVAGRDPARITESERVLRVGRDWMREHRMPDGESDACWGLYLCYSRTGRQPEAVDALQTVRRNIERARANIADPTERARLSARFPQLYACLVTLLYELGRKNELLEAIEAGKGRALADVMALDSANVVADQSFAAAVAGLRETLARTDGRTHYVSYFVDDDCIYAALVTPRDGGEVDVTRVPIGRADLETLANEVREAAASGRGSERLRTELGARLAPLISVLRDVVADGDHVCYCADDALHLLPLQAAAHDGEPLVRLASVSRTHGAHVLAQHLGRPPRLPDRYVVFEVPATVDNADPARREVLGKVGAWLAASIKGTRVLAADAADFAALQAADLRDSVVHFATHGVFPAYNARGVAANPYHASGLLLAANKRLPDLAAVERGKAGDHLVSPARLVASKLALNGSHITLQACVSGLAREGIGGDALGLEWALFQLGASSILSTHWNVSAQTSAAFATRFYRRLSQERMSRAAAWRHTVLEFLARPDAASSAYHWSAFSLSGDWR